MAIKTATNEAVFKDGVTLHHRETANGEGAEQTHTKRRAVRHPSPLAEIASCIRGATGLSVLLSPVSEKRTTACSIPSIKRGSCCKAVGNRQNQIGGAVVRKPIFSTAISIAVRDS